MKTNMRFLKNVLAAVLIFALPAMVFAGSTGVGSKLLSIGPRMIYSTPKDADSGQWSVGVQARLHLSPALGLEGSIDSRSNSYFSNLATVKSYPIQVSMLAYLTPGSVLSPFLLGGVGMYYTQVDVPLARYSDTTSRFGTHLGAGIELMINDYLSIDAAYRYIWLEDLKSKDASLANKTYQDSGSMLTIALNFLF